MSTGTANKLALCWAIGFFGMTTITAFPTGVSRIDRDNRYPGERGLVGQEESQLRECPTMQKSSLLSPSPYPLPDAVQVLDGNPAVGAFSFGNDLLADDVIYVTSESRFYTGDSLQVALGRLGTAFTEFATEASTTTADVNDAGTRKYPSFRSCSDDLDSEIHPQVGRHIMNRRIIHVGDGNQVKLPFVQNKFCLPLAMLHEVFCSWSALVGQLAASVYGPDAHVLILVVSQDVAVIGKRTMLLKLDPRVLVGQVSLSYFTDSSHDNPRAKVKAFFGFVVAEMVERVLPKSLRGPGSLADPCCTGVRSLQGFKQTGMAAWFSNDL